MTDSKSCWLTSLLTFNNNNGIYYYYYWRLIMYWTLNDDNQDLCSRNSHSQMGIRPNKYNNASREGQSYIKNLIHSPLNFREIYSFEKSSLIYHLDLLQYNMIINSLHWRWSTFWRGCVVNGLLVGGHYGIQDSMSLAYVSLAESYKTTVIFFSCLSKNLYCTF